MTLEVLISCMDRSEPVLPTPFECHTDILLINQGVCEGIQIRNRDSYRIRMISTKERGLSRSRNLAIQKARGDIGLLCDDDIYLYPEYQHLILDAFHRIPNADIIVFDLDGLNRHLKYKEYRLKYLELLRISSVQIAFRREAILKSGVRFDPLMGAGSGNGAQEENKFLMDCFKQGLSIYSVPLTIGKIVSQKSTWFRGYNKDFFFLRGIATRQLLGLPLSIAYALYYVTAKRDLFSSEISPISAFVSTVFGCIRNDIQKQRQKIQQMRNEP